MNAKQAKRLRSYVNSIYSALDETKRRAIYQTAKEYYVGLPANQRPVYLKDVQLMAEVHEADPAIPLEKLKDAAKLVKLTGLSVREGVKALRVAADTYEKDILALESEA